MTSISRHATVPFQGTGAGVEPLSWGQWEIWEGLHRLGTWAPVTAVQPLPAGTTLDDVVSEWQFMLNRHQSMRTRLRFDPDGPQQVVAGEGELEIEIVEADGDPAKTAEVVARRYRDADLDFAADWPQRIAVVCERGVPHHQVVVACRLVTDGAGAAALGADLAARDPETGEAAGPPAAMQPLAQARWQRSPAGKRQSETALRYWERWLRRIPARRLGTSTDPRRPRYWRATLDSPAAHLAVQAIAARAGCGTPPVALARVTGVNPVMTRVVVNNRFRPGLADVLCPLAQTGPFVVDVGGTSFEEVLARTQPRTLAAYKHAYYDASKLYQLVERVSQERDEQVHIGCFFDDRRLVGQPGAARAPATGPTAEQVRAALPRTTLRWDGQQDEPLEDLFVHLNAVPDTMEVAVQADTHRLSPAGIEAFLRGMEAVAVEAAADLAAPTRVPAA